MKIPRSVQLLGVTVSVKKLVQKTKVDRRTLGQATFCDKTIWLAAKCRGRAVPADVRAHTFFHELLHQVLNSAGYDEHNGDEQFVDVVAGLLHQALGPHMR